MEKNAWQDCNTVESVYSVDYLYKLKWLKINVAMVAPISFSNFDHPNRGWFDNFCQNLVLNYTVQSLQPPKNYTVYLTAGFDFNWNKKLVTIAT